MIPKAVCYVGCEVRMNDCYETVEEKLPNCECWEKLAPAVKEGLRGLPAVFCPACQAPVDKKVFKRNLRFQSQVKAEAEENPEVNWPRVLATASVEAGGTSKGYRVFPAFEKGSVRRDVVLFGLPVWQSTGAYNGDLPATPDSKKMQEIEQHLKKLGLYSKSSFRLRFYFAQEPGVPALANTPVEEKKG